MYFSKEGEVKPFQSYSITRVVICVILFNVALLCASLAAYFYFASMHKPIHARIVDFLIIGGATMAIPLLYRLGVSITNKLGPHYSTSFRYRTYPGASPTFIIFNLDDRPVYSSLNSISVQKFRLKQVLTQKLAIRYQFYIILIL